MKKVTAWWKRRSRIFKIFWISLFAIFFVARVSAPFVVKAIVLNKLNKIEGYTTTIEDVDISVFSPSISFHNMRIYSDEVGELNPLFQAEEIKGELMTCSLQEGQLLTHPTVTNPIISFIKVNQIDSNNVKTEVTNYQGADSVNWREEIRKVFALKVNEMDIVNGSLRFQDYTVPHTIVLHADSINANLKNLANSEHLDEYLYATGDFDAKLMGHARMTVGLEMNPEGENAAIDLDMKVEDLDITTLNDYWRSYANLDFERGHFAVTSKLELRDGQISGEIHPKSSDFEIFNLKLDQNRGLRNMAWQGILKVAARLLLLNDRYDDKVCSIAVDGDLDHLTFSIEKNSDPLLTKLFVKALNDKVDQHSFEFVKLK